MQTPYCRACHRSQHCQQPCRRIDGLSGSEPASQSPARGHFRTGVRVLTALRRKFHGSPSAATDSNQGLSTLRINQDDNNENVSARDNRRLCSRGAEGDPSLKVVAEAGDGQAALAQIQELKPTIAVIDVDMPRLDGLGVAREIRKKRLPVEIIFLTIHGEEDLFHAAMELGSKGYLLKRQ